MASQGFIDKTLTNASISAQQQGEIIRETVLNMTTGESSCATSIEEITMS